MAQHYAIMLLLCAVLSVAFNAIGYSIVSEVAILAGLLCECLFWARVSRTSRLRASLKAASKA